MNLKNLNFAIIRDLSDKNQIKILYILLSFYLILYSIFSLTITKLEIFPFINRVTYSNVVVTWSFFDSLQYDIAITLVLFAALVLLFYKKIISIPLSLISITFAVISLSGLYDNIVHSFFILSILFLPVSCILNFIINLNSNNKKVQVSSNFKFSFFNFLKVFFWIVSIGTVFEIIRWLAYPFTLDLSLSHWTWKINTLENNLFYALALLSPYLMMLSLLSFLIKANIKHKLKLPNFFKVSNSSLIKSDSEFPTSKLSYKKESFGLSANTISVFCNQKLLFLLLAIFPSLLIPIYPYLVTSDSNAILGTDIPHYKYKITAAAAASDIFSSFHILMVEVDDAGRPLLLLILFFIHNITDQFFDEILKFLPVILSPILVFSVYFLTKTAYPENKNLPLIASILTAFSHQILIGFYAAFYANWIALVTMFLSSMFLIKSIREDHPCNRNIVLFAIFNALTLFFHSYTWSYFTIVIFLYLIWTFVQKKKDRKKLKIVVVIGLVASSIITLDVIKSQFTGSSEVFERDLNFGEKSVSMDEFRKRWSNLDFVFKVFLGGFLSNPVILLLLFLWSISAKYGNHSNRFFLAMLFIAILPILFGDHQVQARIFFNIPFQIPAAIILSKLLNEKRVLFGKPFVFTIILLQITYVFRGMANMYFMSPS